MVRLSVYFNSRFAFHYLRHEATSRFFEKGLNPMQVAAITGHKTLQMLKRYTHLKAEDLARMLNVLKYLQIGRCAEYFTKNFLLDIY